MILIAYGVAVAEGSFHTPALHVVFQTNAENRILSTTTCTLGPNRRFAIHELRFFFLA